MKREELAALDEDDRLRLKDLERVRQSIGRGVARAKKLLAGYGPFHEDEFNRQIHHGLAHLSEVEAEIKTLQQKAIAHIEDSSKAGR